MPSITPRTIREVLAYHTVVVTTREDDALNEGCQCNTVRVEYLSTAAQHHTVQQPVPGH